MLLYDPFVFHHIISVSGLVRASGFRHKLFRTCTASCPSSLAYRVARLAFAPLSDRLPMVSIIPSELTLIPEYPLPGLTVLLKEFFDDSEPIVVLVPVNEETRRKCFLPDLPLIVSVGHRDLTTADPLRSFGLMVARFTDSRGAVIFLFG